MSKREEGVEKEWTELGKEGKQIISMQKPVYAKRFIWWLKDDTYCIEGAREKLVAAGKMQQVCTNCQSSFTDVLAEINYLCSQTRQLNFWNPTTEWSRAVNQS